MPAGLPEHADARGCMRMACFACLLACVFLAGGSGGVVRWGRGDGEEEGKVLGSKVLGCVGWDG